MRFSIIVPVYNAQHTLKSCMDSIFSSENKDFEVIVVDNRSTDKSPTIAKRYPCKLITLKENVGAGSARNIGKNKSTGDIFVFIDADVVIKKDTLNLIDESFKEEKDIVAVTGLLSKECPYKDFFSQYKNLYMNFIFKKCPRHVDFLYGSITAIKREHFLKFDEKIIVTDDTELGQRYKELSKEILLNPELEVIHIRKYNLKNIIRNDFFVPFWWVRSFVLHKGYKDIVKKRRFAHARFTQLMSIPVSYLLLMSLIFWHWSGAGVISLALLSVFLLLNLDFFAFLYRERGLLFLSKSIVFTYVDMLVMGSGVLAGFIRYPMSKKED